MDFTEVSCENTSVWLPSGAVITSPKAYSIMGDGSIRPEELCTVYKHIDMLGSNSFRTAQMI